ncbi:NACHT, LRR and PYD domains-containing protein 14 isoform X7 [Dicentrarchus labrax]|uniref:NACHT, LRR and PYD domains-containing protein 14 isoform X6 n=1 Tax=Dicentrarchus labrax TaxID=13489 RepID=UPI0021F5EEF7|nr:NACHT, LRR and PYD domains-containing protein 14 isoform X6 [Dicentrarchus labrax]XP_051238106.1 NACHT, LRR and PYD domains-containing protein 14 isoform X7 [Dicentrarchus labrax]
MGNWFSAESPTTSQHAETQRDAGRSPVSAHSGSVVNTPQLSDVNVGGNININTYVQPPASTEQTQHISPTTEENIQKCQADLKSYLKSQTKNLLQGTEEDGSQTQLNKSYTELYITEGGSGEVNHEHEVIELECTRSSSEEKKIHLNDIFEPLIKEDDPPQRVLTKGIAGIGKTVAVQKFTHDWAVGKANQTIEFIFPFTFRELNLIKDKDWSLTELIAYYFKVGDLEASDYSNKSILFIFDGLDESKLPLDIKKNKMCHSVTDTTTLDVLLTNLITGKLLHKASVWITSRPAAATKIPAKFIDRVTEVRGFNDEQKEEYFQRNVSDKDVAQKIFDHLQSKPLRSLYIMCHIPVFCWISATALQSLLTKTQKGELPKTVTEMYTHFLIVQTKRNNEKDYHEGETDTDVIMKLGKLAFEQLQKGNIIFYEDDLKSCQIDLTQAAVYSGVCTQIIRKEFGLHKQNIYSFIHLSIQEFLAALYVLETFIDNGKNLLSKVKVKVVSDKGELPLILLHKSAVDMALDSDYGQWDLFVRFLLGLSQVQNQELLQKFFQFKERPPQSNKMTITRIHEKIKKLSYTDKSINLFHCLNELGDQSLVEQVQKYQSSGDVSKISPAHWSALAYLLLVSTDDLDVFDLQKYHKSEEVLKRLLPVLRVAKTALLSDCNLVDSCCHNISSVLSFKSSRLEELDLSKNNLQDYGMTLLSDGLKSPNCKLQRLCLQDCGITKKGCQALASGLASNSSHLRELDLSNNRFLDEGLELLSRALNQCTLETLRLCECGLKGEPPASALNLNPSQLKNLDLSRNHFTEQAITQLCSFLKHPDCQLEKLGLFKTNLQTESVDALASALASNPSQLRELDLGGNSLGDGGVMKIAALLKDPNCKVDKLRLVGCQFTHNGCAVLASSLKSNPGHLRVLDLTRNVLQDVGVENLSEFLAEPLCQLETLKLKCCMLTAACCRSLTFALSCSSALKELDLSFNHLTDQGLTLLADWLRKPQCRLEILRLPGCTDSSCESLASALTLNPSHLRELELSRTDSEGPGLERLSGLQRNSGYKLQKLVVKSTVATPTD